MKILYFNNAAYGGIALYAHFQANALVEAGCELEMLCPENYPLFENSKYKIVRSLAHRSKRTGFSKVFRLSGFYNVITSDIRNLVKHANNVPPCPILFGSYLEYFSPFWVHSLLRLNKQGFVFGAVLHDPVRDVIVGPSWWHNYSVRKAYSFIDILFLHLRLQESHPEIPQSLPQFVIPHGPYPVSCKPISQSEARKKLRLPLNKTILLSFGHIRDNKNLDIAIRCLPMHPELYLVVAGRSLNDSQKPPRFYRDLAESCGVQDQISWFTEYVPDERVGELFSATDGVLLTYNHGFRSASGVLNLAATFDKPCIASSGPGPLKELVKSYSLGVWVNPDDPDALSRGMKEFSDIPPNSDWAGYRRDNSWELNAKITKRAFENYFPKRRTIPLKK